MRKISTCSCGAAPQLIDNGSTYFVKCACGSHSADYKIKQSAIEDWNDFVQTIKENEYHNNKRDFGKLRYDLIPAQVLTALAEVLTYGANKYAPDSWQTVPDGLKRYEAAMFRHYVAWKTGEKTDSESKLAHLHHLLCNVAFMVVLEGQEVER